jgi:hypothetical protein
MMVSALASGVELAVDALKIPHACRLPVGCPAPAQGGLAATPNPVGVNTHLVAER